jgi:DNA modification methylase
LIESFSKQGDTVVDTFAGAGTTLLAAYRLNKKVVGIDDLEQNINIMKGRLKSI